jgi:hypothetical protein
MLFSAGKYSIGTGLPELLEDDFELIKISEMRLAMDERKS